MASTVSAPLTADEALAMVDAALRYLDEIDFTQLPLAEQIQILQAFEELKPLTAAAYDNIMGAAPAARPAAGRHRAPAPPQR
jgi:hypothetical protein